MGKGAWEGRRELEGEGRQWTRVGVGKRLSWSREMVPELASEMGGTKWCASGGRGIESNGVAVLYLLVIQPYFGPSGPLSEQICEWCDGHAPWVEVFHQPPQTILMKKQSFALICGHRVCPPIKHLQYPWVMVVHVSTGELPSCQFVTF